MNQRSKRPTVPVIAVLLMLGVVVTPSLLWAAEATPPETGYEPPVYSQGGISLVEAIRVTLEHEPAIKLQAEAAASQKGFAQEVRGAFDATLIGELNYEYTQSPLTASQKQAEFDKRQDIRDDIESLQGDITLLEETFADAQGALDNPTGSGFTNPELQANLELINFLIENSPPEDQAGYVELRDSWLNQIIEAIDEELTDPNIGLYAELASEQDRLDKLGPMPNVNHDYMGSISLELRKPYRNGFVLTPFFEIDAEGSGYNGKKKENTLGGTGVTDTYNARVGFQVDIPLARGRGVESAGAQEMAANIDYEASLMALTHAASLSVVKTMAAYWNLVAAQETLAAYQQSLALQDQLVGLTENLIEADEIPRSERPRAQARQANLQALVEDAARSRHQARLNLAKVIGLQVNDISEAPLATDGFVVPADQAMLDSLPIAELARSAAGRRYDFQAAKKLQESGKVLWRAADIDLAPQVDLTFEVSYAGATENSRFTEGLQGALWDKWVGPSAKVGLDVEVPLKNNTQIGMLEQRSSAYRQKAINARDLDRTIKSSVILAAGSLQETARQLRLSLRAVEYYRQALETEMEKFRLGSSTLIDTILTEQRLTDAALALVSTRQSYARLLAELRFATGTLVMEEDGGLVTADNLLGLPQ